MIPFDFSSEISNMVCFSPPKKRDQTDCTVQRPWSWQFVPAVPLSATMLFAHLFEKYGRCWKGFDKCKRCILVGTSMSPTQGIFVDYWDMVVPCRVAMAQFWQREQPGFSFKCPFVTDCEAMEPSWKILHEAYKNKHFCLYTEFWDKGVRRVEDLKKTVG